MDWMRIIYFSESQLTVVVDSLPRTFTAAPGFVPDERPGHSEPSPALTGTIGVGLRLCSRSEQDVWGEPRVWLAVMALPPLFPGRAKSSPPPPGTSHLPVISICSFLQPGLVNDHGPRGSDHHMGSEQKDLFSERFFICSWHFRVGHSDTHLAAGRRGLWCWHRRPGPPRPGGMSLLASHKHPPALDKAASQTTS